MIIEEHLYNTMQCCTVDRACVGPSCMAWKKEMVRDESQPVPFSPLRIKYKESGNGFCGIAHPRK